MAARALVVDQDPAAAQRMGDALRKAGMDVHVERATELAVELAMRPSWGALVAGVTAANGPGLQVLDAARGRPSVAVSRLRCPDLAVAAMRAGANHCLFDPVAPGVLVREVQRVVSPARARKIVAIGAHPDDIELGCGATLARHALLGDRVTILALTRGGAGGRAATRVREAELAADWIGADLLWGPFEDGQMHCTPEAVQMVQALVRDADMVFIHSRHDDHRDHLAANAICESACRFVPNLYAYQAPSSNTQFRPQRFVDVGAVMRDKLRMVGFHKSQEGKPYMTPEAIQAHALYWGRQAHYRPVEAFEVLRQSVLDEQL